ncbi:Snare domain containing protein [Salix suchowensis]|nr:Snare domain containing protein [Salix suchowensis]
MNSTARSKQFPGRYKLIPCLLTLIAALMMYTWTLVSILLPVLSLLYWLSKTSKDPYDLFHLSLNQIGDDEPPKTEWLNMGFWRLLATKRETEYWVRIPFVYKLLSALNVCNRRRTWYRRITRIPSVLPRIPRPASVTGITSLLSHHRRSSDRVQALQASKTSESAPVVTLYHGDAVFRPVADKHPLDPKVAATFDTILALDCAYHFHSRHAFLSQSLRKLTKGRRIALTDICFSPKALSSRANRLLIKAAHFMPGENIVSTPDYVRVMEEIGYVDVKMEDISEDVFPGFMGFLSPRGFAWWLFIRILSCYVGLGASHLHPRLRGTHGTQNTRRVQNRDSSHVRSWNMWRRYSEFDDLHTELTKSTGSPPPNPLPPKHKFALFRSHNNEKLLEERRLGLESYLRAIVSAKDEKWRDSFAFKDFLGVPIGRQGGTNGGPITQFSSSSWLDEHIELQNSIRDIRADINKRDALAERADVVAAHKSNVNAKKKLAGVLTRIGALAMGLEELAKSGLSEGELQRRTDMVSRLQDDCEKLGKMVSIAKMSSASRASAAANGGLSALNPAPESEREALLGSTSTSRPFSRVFGAAAKQPAQETAQTRPLDDHGLLQLQQTQIQGQDQQLSQLTTILQRQRHLGEAIGSEIALQIDMLANLNNEVDRVGGKMSAATKQMNKLT